MLKSIILEAIDFHKELITIFINSDDDHDLQLAACKGLCNLSIDFARYLYKDQ